MNEFLFLSQVLSCLLFSYGALRLGKSALFVSVTLQAILSNLFVLKQMTFLGFEITCSDSFAIGSILSLNLLREYFGKEVAAKAISTCFFFMLFFVVASQLHLRFYPSPYDLTQGSYRAILESAPRLLVASLATFFLVQRLELRLFGWISRLLPKSRFPLRSSLSLIISQLADTLLFSLIGLAGLVAKLGDIILISFLVKVIIVLLIGPLMSLIGRLNWDRTNAI